VRIRIVRVNSECFAILFDGFVVLLLRAQGVGPVEQRKLPVGRAGLRPQLVGLPILLDRVVEAVLIGQCETVVVKYAGIILVDSLVSMVLL
jgi:hypothetical protein